MYFLFEFCICQGHIHPPCKCAVLILNVLFVIVFIFLDFVVLAIIYIHFQEGRYLHANALRVMWCLLGRQKVHFLVESFHVQQKHSGMYKCFNAFQLMSCVGINKEMSKLGLNPNP